MSNFLRLAAGAALLGACTDAPRPERAATARESGGEIARSLDSARLHVVFERARAMPRLRSLIVQWRDTVVGEEYWRGGAPDRPTNIKSASKTVLAAVTGRAVAEGHLRLEQEIGGVLPEATRGLEPATRAITVEDLLTMRAGLQSTSFGRYGEWVSSRNWVRNALERPLVSPPGSRGGPMIYSTGTSHVLSAVLTRATGRSTLRYAREQLFEPLGIPLRAWTTDPQGIYFGGNEMRMTPREMLTFGSLYLHRGRAPGGAQLLPAAWIDSSWVSRGRSPWSGDEYGYGWWIRRAAPHDVYYAWGYGGQFIFVVPPLQLVVVATSDATASREGSHVEQIRRMVTDEIIPAVAR